MSKTVHAFLLNSTCLALVIVGWVYGYVSPIFTTDITPLTKIIVALTVICLTVLMYMSWRLDRGMSIQTYDHKTRDIAFLHNMFFRLGFLGTLIGFSYVLLNMDTSDVSKMYATMKSGFGTKLYVSMTAIIAYFWVAAADHLNRR